MTEQRARITRYALRKERESREARRTGVIHGKAHGMLVQRAQQRVLSVIGVEVVAILVGVDRAHARGDAACVCAKDIKRRE